ncbi:MAG: phenylacetate--CoA ligase family protein [Chitinophagaceae bacterium]|nr:phenylacetate--CoA ligase family protein [Chitinophagaceae bacterium]
MKNMISFLRHKSRFNFLFDAEVRKASRLHHLSADALREYENQAFLKLVRHAFKKSPFYRTYYQQQGISAGDIKSLDDIRLLPVITRQIVRDNGEKILTCPKLFTVKGYTSGTSGTPLVVYRSFRSIIIENAYVWYFRNAHGVNHDSGLVYLRGNLDNSKLFEWDKSSNSLYLSSFNINAANIDVYKKLIDEFKPKGIMAYPSSLELLSNELSKKGLKLNIPIAITSSETLYDFQREKIKEFIGAETFDWYGNAERTIAIEEWTRGRYHLVPGYSIVEFGPDEDIITTSLINFAFPLIRYRVTDSLELADNQPPPSDQYPSTRLMGRIEGRIDDFVHLESGQKIGRLDIAFKGVNNILLSQIIQDHISGIRVNIVANERFGENDKNQLVHNLRSLLGAAIQIDVRIVGDKDIIKTAKGKYKLVINRLV